VMNGSTAAESPARLRKARRWSVFMGGAGFDANVADAVGKASPNTGGLNCKGGPLASSP
jgi:hypothetical protein